MPNFDGKGPGGKGPMTGGGNGYCVMRLPDRTGLAGPGNGPLAAGETLADCGVPQPSTPSVAEQIQELRTELLVFERRLSRLESVLALRQEHPVRVDSEKDPGR